MAFLYVFALTDAPVEGWVEDGRTIESRPVGGVFAVCERRSASPRVGEAELRRQHSIVLRIAESAPAVLPARFGSLMDEAELARILRDRADVVRNALDRVRGHVQMTVRIAVEESDTAARRPALKGWPTPPQSGRAYLQERLRRVLPDIPPRASLTLADVSMWVVDERRASSAAETVTVYHLVRRANVRKYKHALERPGIVGMRVTGPWPPFAFVPDLWA